MRNILFPFAFIAILVGCGREHVGTPTDNVRMELGTDSSVPVGAPRGDVIQNGTDYGTFNGKVGEEKYLERHLSPREKRRLKEKLPFDHEEYFVSSACSDFADCI